MSEMKEKRSRCRHCFIGLIHSSAKMDFEYNCTRNGIADDKVIKNISVEECEKCPHFKSKFIEYPITVNKIEIDDFDFNDSMRRQDVGKLVKIRPCGAKYNNKTYLGIFLGYLPMHPYVTWDESNNILHIKPMHNPAIFIPETQEVIFGAESWWGIVENEDEITDISDETINNQWYVKLLRGIGEKKEGADNE